MKASAGIEEFRGDLLPMYLPEVNEASGSLQALTIVLFQMRRFSLRRTSSEDAEYFRAEMAYQSAALRLSLKMTATSPFCSTLKHAAEYEDEPGIRRRGIS